MNPLRSRTPLVLTVCLLILEQPSGLRTQAEIDKETMTAEEYGPGQVLLGGVMHLLQVVSKLLKTS